jgi:hypothetical protein
MTSSLPFNQEIHEQSLSTASHHCTNLTVLIELVNQRPRTVLTISIVAFAGTEANTQGLLEPLNAKPYHHDVADLTQCFSNCCSLFRYARD